MKENEFLSLYRSWSDEELINAFEKRKDYQPKAVEAMKLVLKERNIEDQINFIISEETNIAEQNQTKERFTKEQIIKGYEERITGSTENDFVFAKKKKQANGTYYEGVFILTSRRYRLFQIFSLLLMGIGGTSLTLFCISLSDRPLFETAQIIFGSGSILFVLSIVLYLYSFRLAKTNCKLYENQEGNPIFELKHPKYYFTTKFPFAFSISFSHRTMRNLSVTSVGGYYYRFNNPVIFLLLSNEQGETVLLEEILPTWEKLPSEVIGSEILEQIKRAKIFSPYPFRKSKVMVLKKILNGLNTLNVPSIKLS
jgi:hypothetical protein